MRSCSRCCSSLYILVSGKRQLPAFGHLSVGLQWVLVPTETRSELGQGLLERWWKCLECAMSMSTWTHELVTHSPISPWGHPRELETPSIQTKIVREPLAPRYQHLSDASKPWKNINHRTPSRATATYSFRSHKAAPLVLVMIPTAHCLVTKAFEIFHSFLIEGWRFRLVAEKREILQRASDDNIYKSLHFASRNLIRMQIFTHLFVA